MKYKLTILQGREVLLVGEFEAPQREGRLYQNPAQEKFEQESLDKVVFEAEQAINAHTGLRAHFEAVAEN